MQLNDNHDANLDRLDFSVLLQEPRMDSRPNFSKAIKFIDEGSYQIAFDLLKDGTDDESEQIKAVLNLRLGKPVAALNVLRTNVWNLATCTLRPDCPSHVQLNFATAQLMNGQVAACLEIVRAVNDPTNEQAAEILANIRDWEKTLSMLRWIDWKICGIENLKGEFPLNFVPGRFGWENRPRHRAQMPLLSNVSMAG